MSSVPRWIRRWVWDLERFGLTPRKWAARRQRAQLPRVTVVSIPKAGTHLVERALCLHPQLYRPLLPTLGPRNVERFGGLGRIVEGLGPGAVLISHLPYSEEVLAASGVRATYSWSGIRGTSWFHGHST